MSEFTTDVRLTDVAVRDTNVSDAVDEPFRAMILDMLVDEAMTVGEIHAELADRGFDRTENTVRHHVNELRDAGLVEVERLEERRGGTSKYYRANTMVLSYSLPAGSEAVVDEMAERVEPQVAEAVSLLRSAYGDELAAVAAEMAPCRHCTDQKYETYLLLTVLRRAFVRAAVRGGGGGETGDGEDASGGDGDGEDASGGDGDGEDGSGGDSDGEDASGGDGGSENGTRDGDGD